MAFAITHESPARLSNLQPLWHRTAPRRLVEKCPPEDPLRGWTAWKKHLTRRKAPLVPPFLRGNRPALLWGWPDDGRPTKEILATALTDFGEPVAPIRLDLPQALPTVALAYALADLASDLSADSWWQLVERLHDVATTALDQRVPWPGDPHGVLRHQLLAGELPLALGYLLPEVRALRALRKSARAALAESLLEVTDGNGLPHARLLPVFTPLFACWTRARWLGAQHKRGCWSREAEVQYQWLVQHALRLLDAGGHFMLLPRDEAGGQTPPKDLLATALELVGDRKHCAAAAATLPARVVPRHTGFDDGDLPERSLESDWSGIAVLASSWSRSATRLALAFADDPVRIELSIGRDKLLVGDWTCATTCDGAPVRVVGEWEESSWETDRHFDYLELGVELSEGLRLERQLLLARDDRVLYLADNVVSADGAPRQLRHTFRLPLAPGVDWRPEPETRDGVLVVGQRPTAVLPLALYEWRSDPRGGSLAEEAGQLVLTQEATGQALCCPLLLDLKPRRSTRERTWRQLTVAESLEVVPRDVAVGFRGQSGRDQWVFYRSFGPAGNRTLLGYNIAGEFAAGRFLTTGKVREWLEIEAV